MADEKFEQFRKDQEAFNFIFPWILSFFIVGFLILVGQKLNLIDPNFSDIATKIYAGNASNDEINKLSSHFEVNRKKCLIAVARYTYPNRSIDESSITMSAFVGMALPPVAEYLSRRRSFPTSDGWYSIRDYSGTGSAVIDGRMLTMRYHLHLRLTNPRVSCCSDKHIGANGQCGSSDLFQ